MNVSKKRLPSFPVAFAFSYSNTVELTAPDFHRFPSIIAVNYAFVFTSLSYHFFFQITIAKIKFHFAMKKNYFFLSSKN